MTRYARCKDMDKTIRRLVSEGWTYSQNGHGRITHPSGRYLTVSVSPSDKYAFRQLERDVKRLLKQIEENDKKEK